MECNINTISGLLMKKIFNIFTYCVVCLMFASPAMALTTGEFDDDTQYLGGVAVPKETRRHWKLADEYRHYHRYELARKHLLLALTTSNSAELRDALQRELQIVDLQIRTLR